jgi:hypothetical protein
MSFFDLLPAHYTSALEPATILKSNLLATPKPTDGPIALKVKTALFGKGKK